MNDKKQTRVEVSLFLGGDRSWKPIIADPHTQRALRVVNAVQVVRRADLKNVFEYIYGWGSFPHTVEEPVREMITFIPRTALGHTDAEEVLRLLAEAKSRVDKTMEKPEQTSLSFRMVIK